MLGQDGPPPLSYTESARLLKQRRRRFDTTSSLLLERVVNRWLPALALLCVAVFACDGRRSRSAQADRPRQAAPSAAQALQAAPPAAQNPAQAEPPREITLTPQRQGPSHPQAARAARPEESRLMPLASARLLPEDFDIGPLQDGLQASAVELTVLRRSERFLDALEQGKLEETLLAPETRDGLVRTLSYYVERGLTPTAYRLGRISFQEPEEAGGPRRDARLNVRLYGKVGQAEGELYLTQTDGAWYVSDLQVGLDMLDKERPPREEQYVPYSYGWTLQ